MCLDCGRIHGQPTRHNNPKACTDPNCLIHGKGGQPPPAVTWGPPIPDVPAFQVVDPDVNRLPLVPVERDRECLDRLEKLAIDVKANAETISTLLGLANTASETNASTQQLIVDLQKRIEEHKHADRMVEPTPVYLDALTAAVIAKLPLRRYQAKTPDGKPFGPIFTKGWTADDDDILYFKHETITVPTETVTIPVE